MTLAITIGELKERLEAAEQQGATDQTEIYLSPHDDWRDNDGEYMYDLSICGCSYIEPYLILCG